MKICTNNYFDIFVPSDLDLDLKITSLFTRERSNLIIK